MRINTNVSALNAQRNLQGTQKALSGSMARLSSGFRINRAADDAAGLGIANKMRGDIRAMSQASKNAEQGNSILQVMEGAANQVQNILERMKELAAQSASDTVDTTNSRAQIQTEFGKLREELSRIVDTTKFQGQELVKGGFGVSTTVRTGNAADLSGYTGVDSITVTDESAFTAGTTTTYTASVNTTANTMTLTDASGNAQTLVYGADNTAQTLDFDSLGVSVALNASFTEAALNTAINTTGDNQIAVTGTANGGSFLVSASGDYAGDDLITLDTVDLQTTALGSGTGSMVSDISLSSASSSRDALDILDDAITDVSNALGKIGAYQNKIEYASQNIKTAIENFTAAESVIRDVDMAEEMTRFSKSQILQQAGTAMLAQANQLSQGVLQLLRG